MPNPTVTPSKAEEVLVDVSARYQPGQTVTLAQIVEAADVPKNVAIGIRKWARSIGRWPYADGRPGWANRGCKRPGPWANGH